MENRFKNAVPFYEIVKGEKGNEVIISNEKLIKFWESLGYRKVATADGGYKLVIVKRNSIVKQVKEHILRDEIRDYTNFMNVEFVWFASLHKDYVVKKHFESFYTIDISRNSGDKDSGYLYFQNKILKVTSDSIDSIEYEDFDGYIWEQEIIKREIIINDVSDSVFFQFLWIIANQQDERFRSLISIIGYLIHSYKDPAFTRAIILMDSEIDVEDNEAHGGTGKSLIGKAIGYIISTLFVDGKTIKNQDKFRLSALNIHHRMIFYDDVKKDFDFESLYPFITGDLNIEKKYKNAEVIPYHESPKILISSNYVVKGGGGNAEKRRKIEFEVSSYFKNELNPSEEFGHRLFDDWNEEEWSRFDNTMIKSLQFYLKYGLIVPKPINLEFNRLKLETGTDFIFFMDEVINTPHTSKYQSTSEILVFDKTELFDAYLKSNPNDKVRIHPNTFKKWIDKYCLFHNIKCNHTKSNGKILVKLNIENIIKRQEENGNEYKNPTQEQDEEGRNFPNSSSDN